MSQGVTPIERCDYEIQEILNRPDVKAGTAPAWLVTLGVCDWEREKRLIEKEEKAYQSIDRFKRWKSRITVQITEPENDERELPALQSTPRP